jgi:hypothetical protein
VQHSPVEKYTLQAAEFGPEGKHFVPGNSRFFFLGGGSSKAAMGGARIAPLGVAMSPKDGCAQRTGAHARPKPTSTVHSS